MELSPMNFYPPCSLPFPVQTLREIESENHRKFLNLANYDPFQISETLWHTVGYSYSTLLLYYVLWVPAGMDETKGLKLGAVSGSHGNHAVKIWLLWL